METLTANLSGKVRRAHLNGRSYLVAPISLIVPGVLNGSNGPLLYPEDEVSAEPWAWDHMPIVLRHPMKDGRPLSARNPDIIDRYGMGFLFRTNYDGKLAAEGWFDEDRTRQVSPETYQALVEGTPMEVSTGLGLYEDPAPEGSTHNGTPYRAVARRYRPDHLAVLPDARGACDLAAGCGLNVNSDPTHSGERTPSANADRMSHDRLRDQLDSLVAARFTTPTQPGMHGEAYPAYVVEVFDRHLIFRSGDRLWKIGYRTDLRGGKVSLAEGNPTEVVRTAVYKPVSNEDSMKKDELVNWLVANCPCTWGEGDRETLNGFSDEKLKKLKDSAEKQKRHEAVANAAKKGFTDPGGNSHEWDEAKGEWVTKAKVTANAAGTQAAPVAKPITEENRLTDDEKAILNYGKQQMEAAKSALIARLLVNVSDDKKEAKALMLAKEPLAKLQELADLLPPAPAQVGNSYGPLFAGAAAPIGPAQDLGDDDALPLPTVNWEENSLLHPSKR